MHPQRGGSLCSNPQGVAQVMIQSFQLSSCAVFNAQMQDVSPMCPEEDALFCFADFSLAHMCLLNVDFIY